MSRKVSYTVLLSVLAVIPLLGATAQAVPVGTGSAAEIRMLDTTVPPAEVGFSADRLEHDFGLVRLDEGKVSARFKVKNSTTETIHVARLFTSCMCTTVSLRLADSSVAGPFGMPGHESETVLDRSFEPGEEFVATMTFDPAAHGPMGVGEVVRQALFQTEEGDLFRLSVKADVLPPKG
jgi:Protein of unknown function (DUF1573)